MILTLGERDLYLLQIETEINNKKKLLLKKKRDLDKKQKLNHFLNGVTKDYQKYYNYILNEKQQQYKMLMMLKEYLNDLINFIKKRPYVKYVTGVSLLHFYKKKDPITHLLLNVLSDSAIKSEERIVASLPGALLAPMADHFIKLIPSEVFVPTSNAGISHLKLGKELILADEVTEIIADKVTTNQIKLPTFTLTLKL